MNNLVAILTGDLVNSRATAAQEWQPLLTSLLNHFGKSPAAWEIYRGDSFQLKVPPEEALLAAIYLKAGIKQLAALDVRIGIGIGEYELEADKITNSTGSAFTRSGECFDNLKKQLIAIDSGDQHWDEVINIMLSLALVAMNDWTDTVSTVISTILENPDKQQAEIAALLNKTQSNISAAIKRGSFDEIKQMELFYRKHYQQA